MLLYVIFIAVNLTQQYCDLNDIELGEEGSQYYTKFHLRENLLKSSVCCKSMARIPSCSGLKWVEDVKVRVGEKSDEKRKLNLL